MRIDLERHQAQRVERRRLHDRHVVSRSNGRARYIRARARAHVTHSGFHSFADGRDQIEIVQGFQQPERIPPAHQDRFGRMQGAPSVGHGVQGIHRVTHLRKTFHRSRRVCILIMQRERHEKNPIEASEEIANLRLGVVEITATPNGRTA